MQTKQMAGIFLSQLDYEHKSEAFAAKSG